MKIILSVIGGIVVLLIGILAYYGMFATVEISEKNVGPFWVVYEKHIGEYKNVGPVMDEIYYSLLNDHSIETTKGFGIYYDNPQKVDKDKLRSVVGCILKNADEGKIEDLRKKFKVKKYPASVSIVGEFPFKGKLSIIMGIFKAYPKLTAYIEKKGNPMCPIMEIYDTPNKKISYVASVNLDAKIFNYFLAPPPL